MAENVRRRMLAAKLGASIVFLSVMSGIGLRTVQDADAAQSASTKAQADEQARVLGLVLRSFASASLLGTSDPRAWSSTAKEPRPASHFRLVLNSISSAHVKNNSLRLADIRRNEVFSFKQGSDLRRKWSHIELKFDEHEALARSWWQKVDNHAFRLTGLEDESRIWWQKVGNNIERLGKVESDLGSLGLKMSKVESDLGSLGLKMSKVESDLAGKLGSADAAQLYALQDDVVQGPGQVMTATAELGEQLARLVTIPGFGELEVGITDNGMSVRFTGAGEAPLALASSTGENLEVSPGKPAGIVIQGGLETLQIADPATGRVATVSLSEARSGAQREIRHAVAQILIGL